MPKRKRNTLQAQIAAESDLEKKLALAYPGHNDTILGLAVEFSKLRRLDLSNREPGKDYRVLVRGAVDQIGKVATEALMNWQPEVFDQVAKAMRKVARGGIRSIESEFAERLKWIEVLELEIHNSNPKNVHVSLREIAARFPKQLQAHGLLHKDLVGCADIESIERSMRRLRKTLGLPPLTHNGA
jgi:magnesium-transporting ATPase (P-type)